MRVMIAAFAVVGLLACVGCQNDQYAEMLVKDDPGRLATALTGTGDSLIKQKRIDLHKQYAMSDKVMIDTWVIRARGGKPSAGTMVLLHGFRESKAFYLSAGEKLAKLGYDVVLVDLRAHGDSTGKYTSYGANESKDVQAVMKQLQQEKA